MDQMADETILRADEKDKRKAHACPDNAAWVRGEKFQMDEVSSWRVSTSAENKCGETSKGTDFNQPRKKNNPPPRLFSLNKNPIRYSAAVSNTTDDLPASQQSNMAGFSYNLEDHIMLAQCYHHEYHICIGSLGKRPVQPVLLQIPDSQAMLVQMNPTDYAATMLHHVALGCKVDCADIVLNCLFCRLYGILPDSCARLTNHCWPNYKHVVTTVESTHSEDDDSCVELDCGFFGSCHDASDCLELAMEVSEICYH